MKPLPPGATGGVAINVNQANRLLTPENGNHLRSAPVVFGMEIRGGLDAAVLEASLAHVARAHTSLRTFFPEPRTGGYLVPAGQAGWPVRRIDLTTLAGPARKPAEDHHLSWLFAAFEPDAYPLHRALLLRYGTHHLLGVAVDHLIFDGMSIEPFMDDVATAYNSIENGEPVTLTGSDAAGFATLEREFIQSADGRRATEYWWDIWRATGPYPKVTFTGRTAHQDPAAGQPAHRARPISMKSINALREELGGRHYSVFCLVATALMLGLRDATGRGECGIIIPSSRRAYAKSSGHTIGFLNNKLVLRADLAGARDFAAAAEIVSDALFGSMEHEMMPFEHLVNLWAPEYRGQRPDHAYISLNLQQKPIRRALGGAEAIEVLLREGGSLGGSGIPMWIECGDESVCIDYKCPAAVRAGDVDDVLARALAAFS